MDHEVDKETIQGLINQELKEIIRLQHLIQVELDELVEISEVGGSFHVAIKNGEKSIQSLASFANIPLGKEVIEKFEKMKQNLHKKRKLTDDSCEQMQMPS